MAKLLPGPGTAFLRSFTSFYFLEKDIIEENSRSTIWKNSNKSSTHEVTEYNIEMTYTSNFQM